MLKLLTVEEAVKQKGKSRFIDQKLTGQACPKCYAQIVHVVKTSFIGMETRFVLMHFCQHPLSNKRFEHGHVLLLPLHEPFFLFGKLNSNSNPILRIFFKLFFQYCTSCCVNGFLEGRRKNVHLF